MSPSNVNIGTIVIHTIPKPNKTPSGSYREEDIRDQATLEIPQALESREVSEIAVAQSNMTEQQAQQNQSHQRFPRGRVQHINRVNMHMRNIRHKR